MIQRIQSIFLLLISLITVLCFITPFQLINTYNVCYILNLNISALPDKTNSYIYLPFILNCIILLFTLFSIFLFKKRKLQMRLCSLIAILSGFLSFFFLSPLYIQIKDDHNALVNYTYSTFLPFVNIVFAFIAKRFIKNDEELVKSADRIR